MLSLCLDFFEKKIQPAAGSVAVQLLVPKRLIPLTKPVCKSAELLRREVIYCRLDFLNPAHHFEVSVIMTALRKTTARGPLMLENTGYRKLAGCMWIAREQLRRDPDITCSTSTSHSVSV